MKGRVVFMFLSPDRISDWSQYYPVEVGSNSWIRNGMPSRRWGHILQSEKYRFAAVTPSTHSRVLRHLQGPTTLQSIFGWNLPFERDGVAPRILDLLTEAEALDDTARLYRSKVRFATLGDLLFVHSGFPTTEQYSVFFGPDTYRFARLLRSSLCDMSADRPLRLIDIGSGSGAGGIYAARLLLSHDGARPRRYQPKSA